MQGWQGTDNVPASHQVSLIAALFLGTVILTM
jgi:hypothetical protein